MRLFKKKYVKESIAHHSARDKVANRVVSGIIKVQTAFARFMDKKINPLSLKRKKRCLCLFITFFSAYCLYLVVSPFTVTKKNRTVKIQTIQFPKYSDKAGEAENREGWISGSEYNRIHSFRLYMDSLAKDESGKKIYDSILSQHPGLMDSITLLEELYQFQK